MAQDGWVYKQATVEVRYPRTMSYLDRSGSIADKLVSKLGEPFVAALPTPMQTQVLSPSELITTTFNFERFAAQQELPANLVRLLHVAMDGWSVVSEKLTVREVPVRVGVRIYAWYEVDSVEAGYQALLRVHGFDGGKRFLADGGDLAFASGIFRFEDYLGGGLRLATDVTLRTGDLPPGVEHAPENAVQIDMDYSQDLDRLSPGMLWDRMLRVDEDAKRLADKFASLLSQAHG